MRERLKLRLMVHRTHTVIELKIDRVNRLIEHLRTFVLLVPPDCLPRYITLGGVYAILIAEGVHGRDHHPGGRDHGVLELV